MKCVAFCKTFLQIKKVAAKIKVVAIVNICCGDEVAAHKRRNCFKIKFDLMRIHKICRGIWTTIVEKPCCFPFEVKDVPLFLRGKLLA